MSNSNVNSQYVWRRERARLVERRYVTSQMIGKESQMRGQPWISESELDEESSEKRSQHGFGGVTSPLDI